MGRAPNRVLLQEVVSRTPVVYDIAFRQIVSA